MDNHGMASPFTYKLLCGLIRFAFRLCHPVIRIEGREHVPEGPGVICANHSHLTDPIWIVGFSRLSPQPRIMAKKELFSTSLFRWFLAKFGAFPVDRGNTDIKAIKTALHTLKEGNKLLIFPEGTRVRPGQTSEPHSGAVLLAHRVNAPIIPLYLSVKKGFMRPITLRYGRPYHLDFGGCKPDSQMLERQAVQLMEQIYAMGDGK